MTTAHPPAFQRALALAIEAGQEATTATRRLITRNSDPDDPGTVFKRVWMMIGSQTRAVAGPPPTGAQIERACQVLDEFVSAVAALNETIDHEPTKVQVPTDWSARLWASLAAAADVHNEANDALATLGRYRVNIIMERPLDDQAVEPAARSLPGRAEHRANGRTIGPRPRLRW